MSTDIFDSSYVTENIDIEMMFDTTGSVIAPVKIEGTDRSLRPDIENGAKIVRLCQSDLQLIFAPNGITFFTVPGTTTPLLTPSGAKILRESNSTQNYVLVESVYDSGLRSRVNIAGVNSTRVDLSIKGAVQVAVYHPEVFSEYTAIQAAMMLSPTAAASMIVTNILGGRNRLYVVTPGSNPPKKEIHPLADGLIASQDIVCYVLNASAAFNSSSITLTGYPLAGARMIDDEVLTETLINVLSVTDYRVRPAYNAAVQELSQQHGGKSPTFCNLQALFLTKMSIGSLAAKKYENDASIIADTVSIKLQPLQMQSTSFTAISGNDANTMTGVELMKRLAINAAKSPLPENIQYSTEVEDFSRVLHLLSIQEQSYNGIIDRFVDGVIREVDSRESRVYEAGQSAGLSRNDVKAILDQPMFLNRRDLGKTKSERKASSATSEPVAVSETFDKAGINNMNASTAPVAAPQTTPPPAVSKKAAAAVTTESEGLSPKGVKAAFSALQIGGVALNGTWETFKDELEGMEGVYMGDNLALTKQYNSQFSIGFVKFTQTVTKGDHAKLITQTDVPKKGLMLAVGDESLYIPAVLTGVAGADGVSDIRTFIDAIDSLLGDVAPFVEGAEVL